MTGSVENEDRATGPGLTAGPGLLEADEGTSTAVRDPGVVSNTVMQLLSQGAGFVFTAVLTLYLVHALGASRYGIYTLAVSISSLLLYPAGLGLPMAVGRFIADHRQSVREMRAILALALRVQVPVALLCSFALLVAAEPVAKAYGHPDLVWPLRIAALGVFGQTLFGFLTSIAQSFRRSSVTLWMSIIESATETSTAVALVIGGAGAAGAVAGKAIGYTVATAAGLFLTLRLLGGMRRRDGARSKVGLRRMMSYASAMFVVDVTWTAISAIDILFIGAMLNAVAVGSFGAVTRIMTVLGYLGVAVASGVAPRLSLAGGAPDTRAFAEGARYLIIVQGLIIAPFIVWATPIVNLLLGPGYKGAAEVMRVLTLMYFVGAPAALVSVTVTYLGEGRRRVAIMLWILGVGLLSTYLLIRAVGLVGAAIADDIVRVLYVAAHFWLCSRLISIDLRRLAWCCVRTVLAAGAMALPMLAIGTQHLTAVQWCIGLGAGTAAYGAVLILTREISIEQMRAIAGKLRRPSRGATG
ncbi:MAG: oligosaccharide flippase family protein [Solirubrobacteraceae bacterium]